MAPSGKDPRGEKRGTRKLTEAQVVEILAANASQRLLGERYGVSGTTIRSIQTGKLWVHIPRHAHLLPDPNSPKEQHEPKLRPKTPFTLAGVTHPSFEEAAKAHGMAPDTLRKRLRIGWTHEQAVSKPLGSKLTDEPVTVEGVTYRSLPAAAKEYGLDRNVVYQRYRKLGWTIEQALGVDPPPMNGRRTPRSSRLRSRARPLAPPTPSSPTFERHGHHDPRYLPDRQEPPRRRDAGGASHSCDDSLEGCAGVRPPNPSP